MLTGLLNQPEYVHVVINHLPLVGLPVAMLALTAALVMRNRGAILLGLALVSLMALSIWPVSEYGQAGFDRVLSMADENGQAFLKEHAQLVDRWSFLYYLTGGIAVAGFALAWKWPRVLAPLAAASVVAGMASIVAGIFIAQAGGQIRHREFRNGPPPALRAP
jgi:hypothetical protein